jgi:hypothetical protein
MLVADFITRCGTLLQDSGNTRWSEAELVAWLNDAQRATVMLRPDANAVTVAITVDPYGNVNPPGQVILPSDGIKWIDVICNERSGKSIKLIENEVLDAINPAWVNDFGGDVKYWMYDPRNPKVFYFYPKMQEDYGNRINAIYSALPIDCIQLADFNKVVAAEAVALSAMNSAEAAALAGGCFAPVYSYPPYFYVFGSAQYNLSESFFTALNFYNVAAINTSAALAVRSTSLNDIYTNALLEYVLYKAYSKDAEYSQAGGRAALHYQAFVTELGLKSAVDTRVQPSVFTEKMNLGVAKTGAI